MRQERDVAMPGGFVSGRFNILFDSCDASLLAAYSIPPGGGVLAWARHRLRRLEQDVKELMKKES